MQKKKSACARASRGTDGRKKRKRQMGKIETDRDGTRGGLKGGWVGGGRGEDRNSIKGPGRKYVPVL